jgi:predicted flap endonuclease-1-like 5' DNA nuclease
MVRLLTALAGLVFAFTGVLFLAWLLWLLWKRLEQEPETKAIEIKGAAPGTSPEPPVVKAEVELQAPPPDLEQPVADRRAQSLDLEMAESTAGAADDLRRIEGIGPKIAGVLGTAGISSFAQLADTQVSQLRHILEEADPRLLRLVDPTTWPEQAALAAGGDWDAFEALLGELKAGRRQ